MTSSKNTFPKMLSQTNVFKFLKKFIFKIASSKNIVKIALTKIVFSESIPQIITFQITFSEILPKNRSFKKLLPNNTPLNPQKGISKIHHQSTI